MPCSSPSRLEAEAPQFFRRAAELSTDDGRRPTGYEALDRRLNGGWPTGVLIEVLVGKPGSGELGLLLPAFTAPAESASGCPWTILVDPPWLPYAPALRQRGMELSRLLVVRSGSRHARGTAWAIEEALRSTGHSKNGLALMAWLDDPGPVGLRRLQLMAGESGALLAVVRPARFRAQRSPAALRLELGALPCTMSGKADGDVSADWRIDIFKHRGGRPATLVLHGST